MSESPNRVRDIDTRLLRCFKTVAESGAFTHAAAELMLSQQAVSNQIKALERLIGESLFERSASGAVLTLAGQQLLPHAEKILRTTEEMFVDVVHTDTPVRVAEIRGRYMMLDMWDRHRLRYPDSDVSIRDLAGDDQITSLRAGRIDLAMTRYRPLPGLEGFLLRFDRLAVMSLHGLDQPKLRSDQFGYPSVPGAFRAWDDYIEMLRQDLQLNLQRVPYDITMMEAIGRAQIRGQIPPTLVLGGMQEYPEADSFAFTSFADIQPYYPWGLFWRIGERRRHVLQFIDSARDLAGSGPWLRMTTQLPVWLPGDMPES